MGTFDKAVEQINRGRDGNNKGIPIPFERLRGYLPDIQQKTYYLLGAATKAGKTSLADDIFFYGAYDYVINNPDSGITLDIDYFSYEIDSETKIIKGIARKLWHDYGIVADVNSILSRGKNHCNDELYELVLSYRDYFEKMQDCVTIHDMADNPTGMYKYLRDKAEKMGTIHKKNINKDPDGTPIMRFDSYTPHDPNKYWIIIIDHIALMVDEKGSTTKQNIDKMSKYLVSLRNNFRAIPVVIQQLSFSAESEERQTKNRLTPTLKDFGDSKYTTRDANVIMALFSPYKHKLDRFQNYNVGIMGNSFRNFEILENRDGEPGINVGLNFIAPSGTFRELPPAAEMGEAHYDYAKSYKNNRAKYRKQNGVWVEKI